MANKLYPKLPPTELGPNSVHTTTSGEVFWVTRNPKTNRFTLWKAADGGFEKRAAGKSPVELYSKINW